MPFKFSVLKPSGAVCDFTVDLGGILFVLGANGSGKSSLMHRLYGTHSLVARRVSAHRQTWFDSDRLTLSPEARRNAEINIQSQDAQAPARWREEYSADRATIAIYDLINAENVRARSITEAVDQRNLELASARAGVDAPLKTINELLKLSNIQIEITVKESEQIVAKKMGGAAYSIAELSDGERGALLIAATVLTVKEGTLVLIDEPERHLHRSIISPLLSLLFARRKDCAFIIATHDVILAMDNPGAQVMLVRACAYSGDRIGRWDVDLLAPGADLEESIKKDVLGARRKVLFVEGTESSLDKPLYSLVFPGVSVVAKSSCRDVEHAVFGIRDAATLHWIHAFGVIDNDRRTPEDLERLRSRGVYAVSVYSVESIYYHPEIQRRVVDRHAAVTGGDSVARLADALTAAIDAVGSSDKRMSERVAERALRQRVLGSLPGRTVISEGKPVRIEVDVAGAVAAECSVLKNAVGSRDWVTIVSRYPVRETPALSEIAKRLGFQSRAQYEGAVLKLLMDDDSALAFVRSLFGPLVADIEAA